MGKRLELRIVAQSEDDFDELCDQAEALSGVTLRARRANKEFAGRLVIGYRYDDSTLEVTFELDADVATMLDLSINGRETLSAIEGLTQH
ncbi:hypothetical protein BJG93_34790 (plasmid) [Paraburkholderia sprentiae WSM5005]|uniref:Uncharacterized protein n=1 Tax=Paraburkholderia sprentiae WSM5005 TaxID=754502 RepID=A0ACA8AX49_9BURK|nr:hypothetical protein [Paraburkholderia sprentiae]APA90282.1 hypothetical protein BJG93_34790 [Paraburkholderia sprentiae WSM5005]